MLADVQPWFCWEGVNQKLLFFCSKMTWFIHRVERINAVEVCHRRGIVSEYLVTVDRGLRADPQMQFFFVILQ